MSKDVDLTILMPEKVVMNDKIYRAVLSYEDKTITVLKDRAPTLIGLNIGLVQILDETYNIIDEWFLAGGVADIKSDTCTILTEACFNKKDLSLEKAKELDKSFPNPFYKWLVNYFEKENSISKP